MRIPSFRIASAVARPTPWNFSIGRESRSFSASCGRITVRPSGLRRSEAVLARNLLKETPADAVRPPVARRIFRLISRAIVLA